MRQLSLCLCLSVTAFLVGGCAVNSPATEANLGNDQALINLVMSGQASANTVLPFYETTKTAFCALLPTKSAAGAAAIDKLLQQGADVNKKCRSEVTPDLPLDVVIHFIGYANEPGPAQSPQDAALFQARAEKLLALGAKSARGSTQMSQVLEEAGGYTDALLAQIALREEMQRQAKNDSIFNLENLTALSQIAGGVATNYAAAKGTPTSSLNLIAQLPATSSQEKQRSGTFSGTRTDNLATVKRGGSDAAKTAQAPAAAQPAPTPAIYKFQSSISFRSPNMSEEKARKWVADDRARMNSPRGINISYAVNKETPITCHEVGHNVTNPKSICEMTVTWDVVSHFNPDDDLKQITPAQAIQK